LITQKEGHYMTHSPTRGNSHKERGQGCVSLVDNRGKQMSRQGFFPAAYLLGSHTNLSPHALYRFVHQLCITAASN
jgi:hypothetical protein